MYLANFVDRSNVGNAKILGLEADLGLNNNQYAIALAVFFVFYIVSELPSNLVLKRMTPKIWLPFLVFTTGIIVMCIGFVKTYGQFLAVRSLLGIFEGGLYPGSLLLLSTLYTREELALRVGIFYASASLSGAFGGLLARGLSSIPKTSVMHGSWRWVSLSSALFIVDSDVCLDLRYRGHHHLRACRRIILLDSKFDRDRHFPDAIRKRICPCTPGNILSAIKPLIRAREVPLV